MKYFIKANDTAIDIQLRNLNNNNMDNVITKKRNLSKQNRRKIEGIKIEGKMD